MATNEEPPVAERAKVKVKFDEDLDLDVNAATLELLQHRIESQVFANMLKRVGIPAGGSVLAIVVAMVSWVPSQIEKVVGESKTIKDQVEKSVSSYLAEGEGQQLIKTEIDATVRRKVTAYLEGAAGEQIIKDTINKELRNVAVSRASNINTNKTKTVISVSMPELEKGGASRLDAFLDSEPVKEAGSKREPFVFRFLTDRRGYYQSDAIAEHVLAANKRYPVHREFWGLVTLWLILRG